MKQLLIVLLLGIAVNIQAQYPIKTELVCTMDGVSMRVGPADNYPQGAAFWGREDFDGEYAEISEVGIEQVYCLPDNSHDYLLDKGCDVVSCGKLVNGFLFVYVCFTSEYETFGWVDMKYLKKKCSTCRGLGSDYNDRKCSRCNGKGYIQ